jgi:hypothetical protein
VTNILHKLSKNQTLANRVSLLLLFYVASASTVIAGVLHLAVIPMFFKLMPFDVTIFFLISGAAQVFWVIPILRRWSNLWHYVGIAGTTVLIALFVIAVPGRGLQVNEFEIMIELVQIIFIMSSIMIVRERTLKTKLASARES